MSAAKKKRPLKRFVVLVIRTEVEGATFVVEAEDESRAHRKARYKALTGVTHWVGIDQVMTVESVQEVTS